jgi:hypothetical protein
MLDPSWLRVDLRMLKLMQANLLSAMVVDDELGARSALVNGTHVAINVRACHGQYPQGVTRSPRG